MFRLICSDLTISQSSSKKFKRKESLSISSAADTPCSCLTITRGRRLKEEGRFANKVSQVGNKRKEIARRYNQRCRKMTGSEDDDDERRCWRDGQVMEWESRWRNQKKMAATAEKCHIFSTNEQKKVVATRISKGVWGQELYIRKEGAVMNFTNSIARWDAKRRKYRNSLNNKDLSGKTMSF